MSPVSEQPRKFKPERPIYLNESNTGCKTRDQVDLAIEQLRDAGWLCTYGEKTRPFLTCFNNEKEFQEFKKSASDLKITLKESVIKYDEEEFTGDDKGLVVPGANVKSSFEDSKGKVHIER